MSLITLFFAVTLGWGANPTRPDRGILRVPFWVTSGEPAKAPPEAKLNGSPAKVLRLQGPEDDLVVLLVLDLAGDLAQVEPAREAVIASASKLPSNAWVALMRAQDGLEALLDPTPNREKLTHQIQELALSRRAGLLDTVETAAQIGDGILLKSRVRVALFYVTDSNITNYREDYANPVVNSSDSRDMSRRFPEGLVKEKISQLRARLSEYETPLFIVHLDYRSDTLNEAYQTGLMELATTMGGTATFCRSNAEIPEAIAQMFSTIASHQMVEIQYGPGKARQWELELNAEGQNLKYRTRLQRRR